MAKGLENIIGEEMKKDSNKVLVTSDWHIPYQDDKAIKILYEFSKDYQPDTIVINGDCLDYYALSHFDKNPDNFDVQEELDILHAKLKELRLYNPDSRIVYIEGNHEVRLQKYLMKNPELRKIRELKTEKLLQLDDLDIEWVGAEPDYWKKSSGSLNLGDTRIMHGDNALNGASTSRYSGYSAKNTVQTTRKNTIIGHVHRLALHYNSNEDNTLIGIEDGCLCQVPPTANWQQGFCTFEIYKGKGHNYRLHYIDNHKLYI